MFPYGLTAKLIAGGVLISVIGGALLWINVSSFNRGKAAGIAETTERMKQAIARQKADTARDLDRLKTLPRSELEKELEKRCREAGGGDACR